MVDYGEKIAKASLDIRSIKLNPDAPFQWASGYRMPVYNDNRMLLGSYEHRQLVADALYGEILKFKDKSGDIVAGTSTAGIAPASTLAFNCECPLVITEGDRLFLFDDIEVTSNTPNLETKTGGSEVIASTCPFAIPYGVDLANSLMLPFVYVRQNKKSHGLNQQIEGILNKGQGVFLVDYHIGDSYHDSAVKAIEEAGGIVKGSVSENIESKIRCDGIEGKKIVVAEDLISTGGSSAGEVYAYRNKGAKVIGCISIFNYGLDQAVDMFLGKRAFDKEEKMFLDEPCEVGSALTYEILLKVAKEINYLDDEKIKILEEWRADPFNWGEKHGFPKVEKK